MSFLSLRHAFLFAASLLLTPASPAASLPDFTALVEKQGAAVVNISAIQTRGEKTQLPVPFSGIDESDPMFDFFRKFIPRRHEFPGADPDNQSLGSGFIIGGDGYILTNAHVVEEAEEILVRLADKREYMAKVIGADVRSDVALIKIEADGLPRVVLGDPARLKVGEWVVAIGSPFGFDQSVTAGIVSAKGRSLPDENFVPFIQTDVAINPGNSGGPLFNLRGEVVGINSQIYSRTGGFMGLSFAIPIDVVMDVQHQLRTKGRVQRGRIGVAIQEVTRDLADGFGLPRAAGALVSSVEPEGPAARAGLQQGDVIVRFAGKGVDASSDLPRIVAAVQPGTDAEVDVYRDGKPVAFKVNVGEWQDPKEAPVAGAAPRGLSAPNKLGLVLSAPTPAQRRERGIEGGLIVDRAQGAAARAEIQQGDVVLAVVLEGRQIKLASVAEFNRLVGGVEVGQKVTLLVQRGDTSSYVSLRAGK
ncbi:Do family serine endopeptidase [Thauera linaloolentis]|uniref:Probable periplasmic serine endoprotease DegP-like n=1 Tax=Thauera linaloolentis (strain DSM 12138 / JCM 21573 / CCUG 41526 / CIP 105981 / IAM 15112 / NBRC 102519 / 47Lol) TaxID=1123367 RepID=N6Y2W0_THAL4|nr:Do family serine endopeptidase [Thauera linaloolentis]ENO88541.1 serine protease DegQ/MucD [Thauera linaloolentis 47Lol = DSM 12138]MCM8564881.1 Do family serine endopeptidase [Thauera linaloolentis]